MKSQSFCPGIFTVGFVKKGSSFGYVSFIVSRKNLTPLNVEPEPIEKGE
jgi:hypothetical protein